MNYMSIGTFFIILIIVIAVLMYAFALGNILRSRFTAEGDRTLWLIVTVIPIVGPILYFVKGSKNRILQ